MAWWVGELTFHLSLPVFEEFLSVGVVDYSVVAGESPGGCALSLYAEATHSDEFFGIYIELGFCRH
jgi:hypothetical protein